MFEEPKIYSKKRRLSISDYNKLLTIALENKDMSDNMNNSFAISSNSNNILKSIKLFNNPNPNKKLLLEKLDTSNFHKKNRPKESFHRFNTTNYDNSEDLLMAQKLSSSIISERNLNSFIYYPKKKNKFKKNDIDNNIINNNTKEKTSSSFENDIIEASPLEIYNRKMEYLSHVIKIQSFWRKYEIQKKFKIHKFFCIIDKIFLKNTIYYIKIFFVNLSNISIGGKNYPQKIQEKYIIKRNIKFHLIKSNQKLKLKSEEKQKGILRTGKKVISNNCWINLPLTIEKYIKNRVINLYSFYFFENLKIKGNEFLKQKKNKVLSKLIKLKDKKNLKQCMNMYKEKIFFENKNEKEKQKIYYSLISSKSRPNSKNKIFDFQSFYKKNILENIIKKYRYTSIIQKYYSFWKNESKDNNINNNKNKKKRIIKIKKVKKNNNDLNILKEDTFNNVSEISHNISISSNNTINSIQSIKGMKICLTTTNRKMRIKKVIVDKNYYKYIGNNNYNTNY